MRENCVPTKMHKLFAKTIAIFKYNSSNTVHFTAMHSFIGPVNTVINRQGNKMDL